MFLNDNYERTDKLKQKIMDECCFSKETKFKIFYL